MYLQPARIKPAAWRFLIFLVLPASLAAQAETPKTDTVVYEKHGKPQRLYPQWTVSSRPDTFEVYETDISIENGDTTRSRKRSGLLRYSVDSASATAVWLSIYATPGLYRNSIETQECPVLENLPAETHFQYKLPASGGDDNLKLLNCAELQPFFAPIFQRGIDCQRARLKAGDGISRRLLDRLQENAGACDAVSGLLRKDLSKLLQWHGMLAPKKGALRYKVQERNFAQYIMVRVEQLPNGNRRYEITEDTSKAPPVEVRLMRDVGNMERFFKNKKEKPVHEASDITRIELTPWHEVVSIAQTHRSRSVYNGKEKQMYFNYRLERRGMPLVAPPVDKH